MPDVTLQRAVLRDRKRELDLQEGLAGAAEGARKADAIDLMFRVAEQYLVKLRVGWFAEPAATEDDLVGCRVLAISCRVS